DNLIALEMKKSYRPMKEKENDKARLVALTKDSYDGVWSFDGKTLPEHVCGYDLGIYYEIDSKNCLVYIEYGSFLLTFVSIACFTFCKPIYGQKNNCYNSS